MREFLLIFKMRLKANSKVNKNLSKNLLSGNRKKLSKGLSILLIIVAFLPMILLSWESMVKVYPVAIRVSLGEYTLSDAMLSNYIMLGGLMFIAGFFPIIVYNITSNDQELQFLLTLPVKRSIIFFAILAQIFLYSVYPLLILIPSVFSYITSLENNFWGYFNGTVVLLDNIILSLGVSGLIALTIAKSMKRKTSSKLTIVVSLVNILLLIFFVNIIPHATKDNSLQSFTLLMQKFQNVSLNKFNPYFWSVLAIKGNILWLVLFTVIALLSMYGVMKLSKNLEFENTEKTKKKTSKKINYTKRSKSVLFTMIAKDMKLLFREDQTVFMLLYPIALPLIFLLIGGFQGFGALYMAVITTSMYCAMSTYASFGYEKQISPYQLTFPIKKSFMLISKTIAPGILYSLVLVGMNLLLLFAFKVDAKLFLILPFSILIIFEIALQSAKMAAKNIGSFNNYKEAMRSGQLKINLIAMLMSQEVILPFIPILYPKILGSFKWTLPVFYCIPAIFVIINAIFLLKNTESAYQKLEEL